MVQEGVEGEALENDNEPSKDEEDEEPDNKRVNDQNNNQNGNGQTGTSGKRFIQIKHKMHGDNKEENKDIVENGKKVYRLTRQQKLKLI